MELGLFVEPQLGGTYRRLVELAQWAEGQGVAAFARSDHYLAGDESAHATDALTSMAGLAVETDAIRLLTLVSPLTFRHPAVMAKSATTIDEMSDGRFSLGVGTGWMESEHRAFGLDLPDLGERFDRLTEALAYIRTVFDGGGVAAGTHYPLDLPAVLPAGSAGLGIVVGGGGAKKTPTLAGTYADEYNMFVTDPASLAARLAVMREAATAAGRDPDAILVSFAGPGMLVVEDDASHREVLAERAAAREMSAEDYAQMLDERLVPHGPPERAAEAVRKMEANGIDRYYVQEYRPLDDIDLPRMQMVFDVLASA